MNDITFKLSARQLEIVCGVMDTFLQEEPQGETLNLLYSLVERLNIRLRKRLAERRKEYRLRLAVHDALAMRRMLLGSLEWAMRADIRDEVRLVVGVVDPVCTKYIHLV